jgi:hypothetical protein
MIRERRAIRRLHGALVGLLLLGCSAMPEPLTFDTAAAGGTASSAGATTTGGGAAGVSGNAIGGGAGVTSGEACRPVTERRVRRLTLDQYELAVTDLFGARPSLLRWSAPDVLVHGFDTNASALTVSSGNVDDFALAAEFVAGAADVALLAPCTDGTMPEVCASAFAASFAERAFGRPLAAGEQERLASVYRVGAEPYGYDAGIRLVIEAVLMSPYFLYRTELGGDAPGPGGDVSLTPLEVANALSFAVTGMRPDAALRARAANDPAFLSEGVLREEGLRLLAEPRARAHLGRFLRGWLGIRDLASINKIPILFPDFTPLLKADLDDEISMFLEHVLADGGTLGTLLGAPFTFANARIVNAVYQYDYAGRTPPVAPADGSFVPIALDVSRRRGVLSLGGWLAAHSPVHRSSPVDRGLAVRSRFFCQSLPPPPPGALFGAPGESDGVTTTRQKFEVHTATDACRGCHVLMDPIGFGLEMMDAMGRFRAVEGILPVDSSGVLSETDVDGPFTGPAELADKLLASRAVRECFVTQLFRYVEGRDERPEDACVLTRLRQGFSAGDGNMTRLLLDLVLDQSFRARRLEP